MYLAKLKLVEISKNNMYCTCILHVTLYDMTSYYFPGLIWRIMFCQIPTMGLAIRCKVCTTCILETPHMYTCICFGCIHYINRFLALNLIPSHIRSLLLLSLSFPLPPLPSLPSSLLLSIKQILKFLGRKPSVKT